MAELDRNDRGNYCAKCGYLLPRHHNKCEEKAVSHEALKEQVGTRDPR
jgi:hypothetical protein